MTVGDTNYVRIDIGILVSQLAVLRWLPHLAYIRDMLFEGDRDAAGRKAHSEAGEIDANTAHRRLRRHGEHTTDNSEAAMSCASGG